jgi:SAM-dependent methyltransferase
MVKKLIGVSAGVIVIGVAVLSVTPFGRDLSFHVVPMQWSEEPARLAAALHVRAGSIVADIGAGSGAMAVELARIVGPSGRVLATELSAERRGQIANRAAAAEVTWLTVLAAGEHATNLPDSCCDAITMRMVWHHIADPTRFAQDLRRALRPGGRAGIIDFAPGALPHLAGDHGIKPDDVIAAITSAGFVVESQSPDWGGRSFAIVFVMHAEAAPPGSPPAPLGASSRAPSYSSGSRARTTP